MFGISLFIIVVFLIEVFIIVVLIILVFVIPALDFTNNLYISGILLQFALL